MKAPHSPNVAGGTVSGEILLDIRDACDADPQYMRSQIRRLQKQFGLSTQALAQKWQESGISPDALERLGTGQTVSQGDMLQAQLLVANIYADGLLAERADDTGESALADAASAMPGAEDKAG